MDKVGDFNARKTGECFPLKGTISWVLIKVKLVLIKRSFNMDLPLDVYFINSQILKGTLSRDFITSLFCQTASSAPLMGPQAAV